MSYVLLKQYTWPFVFINVFPVGFVYLSQVVNVSRDFEWYLRK
jgi:hypothetical protein